MYKEIVVNVTDYETRVALLEDGTIAELYIERQDEADSAGNIYKGRVQRVLPGMQAAFVDIGLNQAAFLYVDDVHICGYGLDWNHPALAEEVAAARASKSNAFGYGIWTHHITQVAKNGIRMAEMFNADPEIVEVAALLTDVSRFREPTAGRVETS